VSDDGSRPQQEREQAVTDAVVASFDGAQSQRYRTVMTSLVRHLHAFARDVRLTQDEWAAGIDFLTRAGHLTTDRRQEFILASDVLGLSMLTVGINAPAAAGATESTVLGPFFVAGAPEIDNGGDLSFGAKGMPCRVTATVRGVDGAPVDGARLEVWQADDDGLYDVQRTGEVTAARGRLQPDGAGAFAFWTVRPAPYPIPDDGPVGDLLRAGGRGPMRPAHIHLMVTAPGHRTLVTHVFAAGDPHLDDDAVFGVKASLVAEFAEQPAGTAPDGRVLTMPWACVEVDLVLAPAGADPDVHG
jgi:hydroxyquinol 1,2-dioxygenase